MKLLLVKHAMPIIIKTKPAYEWLLSDEGRVSSQRLTSQLMPLKPDYVFASVEPKAAETGRIIAHQLAVPYATCEGLHEHVRHDTTFYDDMTIFYQHVRHMFDQPHEVVFGDESAWACYQRFARAIDSLVAIHPQKTLVIVTHGRVMMSFLQQKHNMTAGETYDLWRATGLAEYVTVDLP